MPDIVVNGVRLHYREQGRGSQTVVFSHSYLLDGSHFEPQMRALEDDFRCIAFDHRGHGRSEGPDDGYSMEQIYADGEALLESLDAGPVHWVGLSTGGFVGLRLAIRRPELLGSLTLLDTSADAEPTAKRLQYEAMLAAVRVVGPRPFTPYVMTLFFGKKMRNDPASARKELERWRHVINGNRPRPIVAFGRAIFSRDSVYEDLGRIATPTLVMVGEEDRSTTPAKAQRIADGIRGAKLVTIPDAAHISTVDGADVVNAALREHLGGS